MGSFFSASRSTVIKDISHVPRRKADDSESGPFVAEHSDVKFIDIVKSVPGYKDVLRVSSSYELYISRTKLHWFLLVKLHGAALPYLTIEITRGDDKVSLIAMMDTLEDACGKEHIQTETMTLFDLCEIADTVKEKMGQYELMKSNCQHFCNNILKWLNYEQFHTTTEMVYDRTNLEHGVLGFDAACFDSVQEIVKR